MPTLTKKIDIAASAFDAGLSNYPARISTQSVGSTVNAAIFTADSGSGADVWFSSDAAGSTAIDARLIYWSDGDSEFAFDVEVALASASTGATFYLQVGDKPGGYGTNAYDSDFLGLWPLMSDFDDYTTNGEDGTGQGGISAGGGTGPDGVLPATVFDGANDRIDNMSVTSLGDFSVESWVLTTTVGDNFDRIVDAAFDTGFWLGVDSDGGDIGGGIREGSSPFGHFDTASNSTWYHLAMTRSGTTKTVYINGSDITSGGVTVSDTAITNAMAFGARFNLGTADNWQGRLSDIALSGTARSNAWLKANYLLQGASPETYVTVSDAVGTDGDLTARVQRRRPLRYR